MDSEIVLYNFDSDAAITTLLEEEIPPVLKKLKMFIKEDEYLVNNIMEFCNEYSYSLDLIADIIKKDANLKAELNNYCLDNNIFKPNTKPQNLS